MSEIAVLGSINMDLVVRVERFPKAGETVRADAFQQFPGGKGANQAVGAARLGVDTAMFGKVGDDPFGRQLLRSLQQDGVLVQDVVIQPGVSSGIAVIWVDRGGENGIAITPGANGRVDCPYVDRVLPKITEAEVLLLQLETPLETIAYLLERLPTERPLVILDPAPAQDLSPLPLGRVDLLTPNLIELESLSRMSLLDEGAVRRALTLLARKLGVRGLVCKAGDRGAYALQSGRFRHLPAYRVQAVDTTAAGDAFNAGLAAALTERRSLEGAVRFANAVGALAVMRDGAQPSMPHQREVETFMKCGQP